MPFQLLAVLPKSFARSCDSRISSSECSPEVPDCKLSSIANMFTPDDLETKMGMGWTQVTGWSFYYHIKLYLKITLLCRLICRLFKVPCFSSFPRSHLWHVTQRSQDHCPRLQKFLRSSRSTAKMAALSGKHSILTILRNNRGLWIV